MERAKLLAVNPVLPSRDVRASIDFEVDFLVGDPPVHGRVMRGDRTYGDPVYIHLAATSRELQPSGEIRIHVGHELDGLYDAYQALGVETVEGPRLQSWGLREFAVREPNGHVIRFCGYVKEEA